MCKTSNILIQKYQPLHGTSNTYLSVLKLGCIKLVQGIKLVLYFSVSSTIEKDQLLLYIIYSFHLFLHKLFPPFLTANAIHSNKSLYITAIIQLLHTHFSCCFTHAAYTVDCFIRYLANFLLQYYLKAQTEISV